MRIDRINVYKILLPFTGDFSISRLQGLSSNTVVVEMVADQEKIRGYGEGLPVKFVTGETPDSVLDSIRLLSKKDTYPWELSDISQIWNFVDSIHNGKEHNAAICALEMSLLDALGKSQNRSIIEYFPKDFYAGTVQYGAAVTLGNRERIIEIVELFKKLDIRHLRIKLGDDFEQNRIAIETVASVFDNHCELRMDPNGVWDRDLAFRHIELILKYKAKIVEEPMLRNEPGFTEFAEKLNSMGVLLMACESAPTLSDLEKIIGEGYYKMVNVKLCRSGGFRKSLHMIDRIRSSGLSFQIGCTLGESGILSAAGRILCLLCEDAMYYDGSYDKYLLKENVTTNNVSFGQGGNAGPLEGTGLGVEVSRQKLERLGNGSPALTIPSP